MSESPVKRACGMLSSLRRKHVRRQDARWWVYYDWLPVVELRPVDVMGNPVPLPARTFTWGLDLLGQNQGSAGVSPANSITSAGGIGGLLATHDWGAGVSSVDDDESYLHFYDGNGNTGQLVYAKSNANSGSTAGNMAAAYEYDVYGNVIAQAGAYAETNRFRFSTKQFDEENGLGYWGYRYYDPETGRWVSRDPIGMPDGPNIYSFALNDPSLFFDPDGRFSCAAPPGRANPVGDAVKRVNREREKRGLPPIKESCEQGGENACHGGPNRNNYPPGSDCPKPKCCFTARFN